MSRIIVLTCLLVSGISAAQPAVPHRNPFMPPQSQTKATTHGDAPKAQEPVVAPQFKLRATLVAGAESLANVDGRMVSLGENVDGYTLRSVDHGQATFTKRGRGFVVTITTGGPAQ